MQLIINGSLVICFQLFTKNLVLPPKGMLLTGSISSLVSWEIVFGVSDKIFGGIDGKSSVVAR